MIYKLLLFWYYRLACNTTHIRTHIHTHTHTNTQKGALDVGAEENPNPLDKHVMGMAKCVGGPPDAPVAPWLFAHAGREHSKR